MPVPDNGLVCDLLWADPDEKITGESFFSRLSLKNFFVSGWQKSSRGVSYLFGPDAATEFCTRMNISMIIRAHQVKPFFYPSIIKNFRFQVVPLGYQFFGDKNVITVFSAPNYCNQFDNAAGVIMINEKFVCRIKVIFLFQKFYF